MFIHLLPEKFTGLRGIGIVEAVQIAGTYPIPDSVLISLRVHPSLLVKLLIMLGFDIELRPYGNHHATVHCMYRIHHSFRIREARQIEFMTAPCIFLPMTPVHHDIVNRNIPLSEPFKSLDHLSGCLVTFAALPVTHSPFRHDWSLSGESTISAYDLIKILSRNEIPIHLLRHLTPPAMLSLLYRIRSIINPESAI